MFDFSQNQSRPEFWDGQGRTYCKSKQYAEAIAAFDKAISLDPNCCSAWNNRGNALCGIQRYAEALACYDKAVAIQPNYHQAWFNRGQLLLEMMAYGNALESFERAIAIQADPRYIHAKAGIYLKRQLHLETV